MEKAREVGARIVANIGNVIVGKDDQVKLCVAALMSGGHILIEGVPGVGKTMLARAMARSIGLTFKRIQCTADLLPTDITGVYVFDQGTREFSFRSGPIMANVVLVDEINRASPKTQSALLECMEERQITVEGITHSMPDPFLVLATRNPTEHGGTFPLPETELDRFLLRLQLEYPTPEEEVSILEGQFPVPPINNIEQVVDAEDIDLAREAVKEIYVDRLVKEYIVALSNGTRHTRIGLPGGLTPWLDGPPVPCPVPGPAGRPRFRRARRRKGRGSCSPGPPHGPDLRRALQHDRVRYHQPDPGLRGRSRCCALGKSPLSENLGQRWIASSVAWIRL